MSERIVVQLVRTIVARRRSKVSLERCRTGILSSPFTSGAFQFYSSSAPATSRGPSSRLSAVSRLCSSDILIFPSNSRISASPSPPPPAPPGARPRPPAAARGPLGERRSVQRSSTSAVATVARRRVLRGADHRVLLRSPRAHHQGHLGGCASAARPGRANARTAAPTRPADSAPWRRPPPRVLGGGGATPRSAGRSIGRRRAAASAAASRSSPLCAARRWPRGRRAGTGGAQPRVGARRGFQSVRRRARGRQARARRRRARRGNRAEPVRRTPRTETGAVWKSPRTPPRRRVREGGPPSGKSEEETSANASDAETASAPAPRTRPARRAPRRTPPGAADAWPLPTEVQTSPRGRPALASSRLGRAGRGTRAPRGPSAPTAASDTAASRPAAMPPVCFPRGGLTIPRPPVPLRFFAGTTGAWAGSVPARGIGRRRGTGSAFALVSRACRRPRSPLALPPRLRVLASFFASLASFAARGGLGLGGGEATGRPPPTRERLVVDPVTSVAVARPRPPRRAGPCPRREGARCGRASSRRRGRTGEIPAAHDPIRAGGHRDRVGRVERVERFFPPPRVPRAREPSRPSAAPARAGARQIRGDRRDGGADAPPAGRASYTRNPPSAGWTEPRVARRGGVKRAGVPAHGGDSLRVLAARPRPGTERVPGSASSRACGDGPALQPTAAAGAPRLSRPRLCSAKRGRIVAPRRGRVVEPHRDVHERAAAVAAAGAAPPARRVT